MIDFLKKINFFFRYYSRQPGQPVRFAFPAIAAVGSVALLAAISASNGSILRIESSSKTVSAGQNIALDVFVTAHVPVNAVDLVIEIPEEYFDVKSIDTGESVITLWTTDPYETRGKVYLSGGTFRKGFKGKHLIATINARAVETGVADFAVANATLLAGDGTGDEVRLRAIEDDVSVIISGNRVTTDTVNTLTGTVSVYVITDIDGDGKVTLADISRFMVAWSKRSVVYDFSGDGKMTFTDFGIILADVFLK